MVLTALFFYATGSYQRPVGVAKNISQKMCSVYIEEVTKALTHKNIIKKYIQFPDTPSARQAVSQRFCAKYRIPGVIGCIDCSHFRIFGPPKTEEHLYYCRKHYHSINVQMGDTDLWTFQEIAFKAEMDRHDDPESEEEAFILCAEESTTRARNIVELRNMIYERGECHPHRMDDAFLLRFLRARRSVPARAHRLLVRYSNFRDQNPHLWRDVDWFGLTKLGHVFGGVLFDRPDVGRLIMCRLGEWDPDDYPVDDLIRSCLVLLEIGIMQPKLQILGGTALLDCAGLTMKHMRQFSPAIAIQAMNVMGFSFPLHMRGVHVINCSRIFETLFHFFKRLAPVDDLWKRVRFHGSDLGALHKYIPPECLPKRYGGHRDAVSLERWLTKIKQYKNKDFDNDMRNLGYAVD